LIEEGLKNLAVIVLSVFYVNYGRAGVEVFPYVVIV